MQPEMEHARHPGRVGDFPDLRQDRLMETLCVDIEFEIFHHDGEGQMQPSSWSMRPPALSSVDVARFPAPSNHQMSCS